MVINAQLKRGQVIRLALLRHFQRPAFYINALAFAGFTAYAFMRGPLLLMLVGWLPLTVYIIAGLVIALQAGRGKTRAVLLPTRYEFTNRGVNISNNEGRHSEINWEHIIAWDKVLDTYVLTLENGPILAIPQSDVPRNKTEEFERLLFDGIDRRQGRTTPAK
jgi:hypothetical protein